jgi:hypothetical protein
VRTAILICLLSAASQSARAQDLLGEVEASLRNCIGSDSGLVPKPSAELPPGLSRSEPLKMTPLGRASAGAYAYEGTNPHEIACGVAVYGPVDKTFVSKTTAFIESYSNSYARDPQPHYRFSDSPARETYWGDPLAWGVSGIALLERPPSPSAPTLEVDFHRILIQ